jgi:hypothetical protein
MSKKNRAQARARDPFNYDKNWAHINRSAAKGNAEAAAYPGLDLDSPGADQMLGRIAPDLSREYGGGATNWMPGIPGRGANRHWVFLIIVPTIPVAIVFAFCITTLGWLGLPTFVLATTMLMLFMTQVLSR